MFSGKVAISFFHSDYETLRSSEDYINIEI